MKITIISNSSAAMGDLTTVLQEMEDKYKSGFSLKLFDTFRDYQEDEYLSMKKAIDEAEFLFLDMHGVNSHLLDKVTAFAKGSQAYIIPVGGRHHQAFQKLKNLKDDSHIGMIQDYWRFTGRKNITSLLFFLGRNYGALDHLPEPEPPEILEGTGIYDPITKTPYATFSEYAEAVAFDVTKPTVGMLFLGFSFPFRTLDLVEEMMKRIQPFANVIPVAAASLGNLDLSKLRLLLNNSEETKANLLMNFLPFRLGIGPMGGSGVELAADFLEELNIPLFHAFFISQYTAEEWGNSVQGLTPSEYMISVMLPELDGSIETIPIGALETSDSGEEFQLTLKKLVLLEERAEKVIDRMKSWLRLQKKPNREKKVAIICYNYPPGEGSLFGASYLDTFQSAANILRLLKQADYDVDDYTAEELMEKFTAGKLVNSGKWCGDQVSEEFIRYDSAGHVEKLKTNSWAAELTEQWGPAPGTVMTDGGDFLIPGMLAKNVFIGLQPSRGVHENPEKVYHDRSILPHHQYLAFYQWLREEFHADAIIHVGAHGTLEFMKGKEVAMSGDCLPAYLVSDLPHVYIYYSGNPSEAMIAKRRSHAVLISYQSAPFIESDLYGDLEKLEASINEYSEALLNDLGRSEELLNGIMAQAKALHFTAEDLDELEHELYRMKRSLIPKGLHIFGKGYSNEEGLQYMKFVLRYDRGDVKSLRRILAEDKQHDYDQLLAEKNSSLLEALDEEADNLVEYYLLNRTLPEHYFATETAENACRQSIAFGLNAYNASKHCMEEQGLLRVLNGSYLPVRLAGDMIKQPEVFPTGYNLYQFDPSQVPTKAAVMTGEEIARQTVEQYVAKHQRYPQSVGVILWGLETSRTQGEAIGQILYYLGIRVRRGRGSFAPVFEVIPQAELNRPRLDVTVNISGFFRDMFPNLMEELHRLFTMTAKLEESEENNYFKANCTKMYERLREQGYSHADAEDLAVARIFGPEEGAYASGLTTVIETKNWQTEEQLSESYCNGMQHVYTPTHRGVPMKALFQSHLSAVEIVSQIRSNHEMEVTDLDHYFEFFGGMAKSVELASGRQAEVYISDTTGETAETESVEKSVARGVRTRMLHPKWIEGMLDHPYHGVQHIAERFQNVLGLAATTNKVENWVFSSLHATYVADEQMRNRLEENNRWAYYDLVGVLLESNQRGYWEATEEELRQLRSAYLELEGSIEEGSEGTASGEKSEL
ncbi:cobaltochelatase CobN [Evansella caseinilytica]|uniref:Cobaltochelatase CobN n=1 Tax=Evansella caseinilytica TaxID=1503961 RepID=A0A1H3SC20_9BACI|nr:cobaltochelatase subunit CobN [Evansella caseinilytica]SDZ35643.1 cobaltochelatase CobN [Evansella caseinilytica]